MSVAAPSNEEHEAEALRRAQRAHEPSMEEILASIRAIIADDREPAAPTKPQIVYSSEAKSAKPAPAPEPSDAAEAAPPAATVVWSRPAAPEAKQPEPKQIEVKPPESEPTPSTPTVVWSRPAEPATEEVASQPAPGPSRGAPEQPPVADDEPLISDETDRAVAASFQALSDTIAERGREVAERLTREMLKPMIKSWLDENLPAMVERLVRAEIQRVARGGR